MSQVPIHKYRKMGVPDGDAEKGKKVKSKIAGCSSYM
jgi:hypothetical protein